MNQLPRHDQLFLAQTRTHISASLRDLFFHSSAVWIICEFLILYFVFVGAWWTSPYINWRDLDRHALVLAFFYATSFSLASLGLGQYERFRWFSYFRIFLKAIAASAFASVVSIALTYLWYHDRFGRLTVGWGAGAGLITILFFRAFVAYLFTLFPYRIAMMGDSKRIDEIRTFISKKENAESKHFQPQFFEENVSRMELSSLTNDRFTGDIIVSKTFMERDDFHAVALGSIQRGVRIIDEEIFYENIFERVFVDNFSVESLIGRHFNSRRLFNDFIKRTVDVTASGLGLIILFPLMFAISALIKLSSPGPVSFIQPRQGRAGKAFNMYKFRTMHLADSKEDASGGFTRKGDNRVTWIGRIIRPLHLDELPQLINIFLGEMSLVGPRPEALSFARKMATQIPQYDLRYISRPGLTGHAQLMAGYMMDTVEDTKKKLAYDLYYIVNQSVVFDFTILLRTFFIVSKKVFY